MPKKRLLELRLARVERLNREAKELEDMQKVNESTNIRNSILHK